MRKVVVKEIDGILSEDGMISEYLIYAVENNNNLAAYIVQGETERDIRVESIRLSFVDNNNKYEDILTEEVDLSTYLAQANQE